MNISETQQYQNYQQQQQYKLDQHDTTTVIETPTTPYPIPQFKNKEEEDEYARTQTQKCSKCAIEKALTEFKNKTSGSQPYDKQRYRLKRPEYHECSRAAKKGLADAKRAAKQAGISTTPSEHDVCAICHKKGDDRHGLVFDHDHITNKFRGWLCDPCNRSMGGQGDKLETLGARFDYICRTDQRHDCELKETVRVALDAANRKVPETTKKPTIDQNNALITGQPRTHTA